MPVWLTIVLALGGSTIVSTIWGWLIHKWLGKIDEKAEAKKAEVEENARKAKEQKENEARLKWQNEVKDELVKPVKECVDRIDARLGDDEKATVLNLRVQMKNMRDKCKKQGYADVGDKATFIELYNHYAKMGGNHFIEYVDTWKTEMENLPLEPR